MNPTVAPYNSCVACFKGDTTTTYGTRGEAEFHIAALHAMAGLPMEQANATFTVMAERELGCDPGKVPGGTFDIFVRLCRDCARRTGVRVGKLDEVPLYLEPDITEDT
jgi:hypothetical protein